MRLEQVPQELPPRPDPASPPAPGTFVIVAPDGSALAAAPSLLDLLITAKVLHCPPKKRRVATKLPASTVTGLRAVIYHGESLGDFLRAAAAGEIARRERLFAEEQGDA